MKILFVVANVNIGEPIGILQLSAILKKNNYSTKLLVLSRHPIEKVIAEFNPDIIAYSVMSPEINIFKKADLIIREVIGTMNKPVLRIMGGPHPTFYPEILGEMSLDAICIGEGDNAILKVVERFRNNEKLTGIPNILSANNDINKIKKERIADLNSLPPIDRDIYYEAEPNYRLLGLRVFMCGRGCPYNCTYCHNHAFNSFFNGCGKIMRRRSVANVIQEIKDVVRNYPEAKLIRFADDTFAHKIDSWLLEFLDRFKKEINLPFYCLMRSNTLSEEMAKLLNEAGCISISMAVESGDENIRNKILKRGLADKTIIDSFNNARKYNIKTYGNTIFAIPGTSFQDDFNSFLFTKKLKMTVPTFGIVCLYPGTELADYAKNRGYLPVNADTNSFYQAKTPLNCFSEKDKNRQMRLVFLATIFCSLPDSLIPLLKILIRLPLLPLYKIIGSTHIIFKMAIYIFPKVYPKSPAKLFKLFFDPLQFLIPEKKLKQINS